MMRSLFHYTALAILLLGTGRPANAQPYRPDKLSSDASPAPFKRRTRRGARKTLEVTGRGLTELKKWPDEPEAPQNIDPAIFAESLKTLCRRLPKDRPTHFANAILDASSRHQIDPFLVGAIMFRMSRCRPYAKGEFGFGLGAVQSSMHQRHVEGSEYRFHVLVDGQWQNQSLTLKNPLTPKGLREPATNLEAVVELLAVNRAQCPANDGAFDSVPHRHFSSHFVWGDRVDGAGPEDRILSDRRRLIGYYLNQVPDPIANYEGLPLSPPLDGAPRKITSAMGDDRDQGTRRHQGIDFESTIGEPVRAIADGVIGIAGVDRKGTLTTPLAPKEALKVPSSGMGAGGLIVGIRHEGGLRSYYMHLGRYFVKTGDIVKAGDLIGEVGRTGIKRSKAHLHFELRAGGKRVDPLRYLESYVFGPAETYLGQRIARKRRRDRAARWRARKAAKTKK